MNYYDIVEKTCRKYKTRNPFELADLMNIIVIFEPLGSIRGFYSTSHRHQVIHINQNLSEQQQAFTCAHELGHAVLHPNTNTPFLRENTFYCINKLEVQANKFATVLLHSDEDIKEYLGLSVPQIASCLGLSHQLIEFRLSLLKQKKVPEHEFENFTNFVE